MKMGGTGSAQEDQIITIQLEQALAGPSSPTCRSRAAARCASTWCGKHVDSTVNNPIECASHWKAGRVRPLAVFDTERIPVAEWKDIPTVKEALGVDIHYLMLRGIFGTPGMPKDAVDWYVGPAARRSPRRRSARSTWTEGALKPAVRRRSRVRQVGGRERALHRDLMTKGGLLKK